MAKRDVSYYYKLLLKKLGTAWGTFSILASVFGCGFAVGIHYEEALLAKDSAETIGEYNLKLTDCENEKIKQIVDLKEKYSKEMDSLKERYINEINELKNKIYGKESK